jgi:hypothetical protein
LLCLLGIGFTIVLGILARNITVVIRSMKDEAGC